MDWLRKQSIWLFSFSDAAIVLFDHITEAKLVYRAEYISTWILYVIEDNCTQGDVVERLIVLEI